MFPGRSVRMRSNPREVPGRMPTAWLLEMGFTLIGLLYDPNISSEIELLSTTMFGGAVSILGTRIARFADLAFRFRFRRFDFPRFILNGERLPGEIAGDDSGRSFLDLRFALFRAPRGPFF